MIKSTILMFMAGLLLVTASFAQQAPYTALTIEPVEYCTMSTPTFEYAGLPTTPYITSSIVIALSNNSQYYNYLTVPGQPTPDINIRSECAGAALNLPVCGNLINYPTYAGIVTVNSALAMPNGQATCLQNYDGGFLAYTFGAQNMVGANPSNGFSAIVAPQNTQISTINITIDNNTSNMAIFGPLPNTFTLFTGTCNYLLPCTYSISVPRPQAYNPLWPKADVYHIYRERNGIIEVLPIAVD